MNKYFLLVAGLFAFAAVSVGQDVPEPASDEDDSDERPDKLEKLQELIGDVSSLPEWFQQVVEKKLEKIREHHERRAEGGRDGSRRHPPRRRPRKLFSEEELDEIDGVPQWFKDFVSSVQQKEKRPKPGPNSEPPQIELPDNAEDWFKEWFEGFQKRHQELRRERRPFRGGRPNRRRPPPA